ncbi:hypothetical protein DAEQUDRAFT_94021 [Daedalea quercina L-15889]|uniref:Uncharacterized protein n=1 Tax=Daedalea quercina L-15889 TaxID=1314783 RepID=A0A165S9V9_9APHY|nr:hypothetical protein DAEQUDRAFT_94021 [Daedalea quercina L-15889]
MRSWMIGGSVSGASRRPDSRSQCGHGRTSNHSRATAPRQCGPSTSTPSSYNARASHRVRAGSLAGRNVLALRGLSAHAPCDFIPVASVHLLSHELPLRASVAVNGETPSPLSDSSTCAAGLNQNQSSSDASADPSDSRPGGFAISVRETCCATAAAEAHTCGLITDSLLMRATTGTDRRAPHGASRVKGGQGRGRVASLTGHGICVRARSRWRRCLVTLG